MLDLDDAPGQWDVGQWPALRHRLTAIFATRSRDEWAQVFEGRPACVTPVLSLREVPAHPHLAARSVTVEVDGVVQPSVAPRFSRTQPPVPGASVDAAQALADWHLDVEDLDVLLDREL